MHLTVVDVGEILTISWRDEANCREGAEAFVMVSDSYQLEKAAYVYDGIGGMLNGDLPLTSFDPLL